MKKINKIIIILLVFIAFIGKINAQSWSPSGAVWVYEKYGIFGGKIYDYVSYIGDTTINSTVSKIMEIKRLNVLLSPNNEVISTQERIIGHEYMYQSGNIIYWWRDAVFVPLYKFNSTIGDKWQVYGDTFIPQHPCYSSISDSVEAINKDVFDFGGVLVNRTFLKSINEHWGLGAILEGIGTMDGPFPKPVYTTACPITDYEAGIGGYLVCYYDTIRGYVGGCNASFIATTNENQLTENNINLKIYPNPSIDLLNVEINISSEKDLQDAKLTIHNVVGQLVYSQPIFEAKLLIPTMILETSIYILSIKFKNGNIINQKIIKK